MRVQILKDFVKQHFPATQMLDYALEVEKITTSKVQSPLCLYSTTVHQVLLHYYCSKMSMSVPQSETKPHPERGWFYWSGFRGFVEELWWLHSVGKTGKHYFWT